MKCNKVFFIMSAYRKEFENHADWGNLNPRRNYDLIRWLDAIGFDSTPGIGVFKGSEEVSQLIEGSESDTEKLLKLSERYDQECILKVYSDNSAFLVYRKNGEIFEEYIGKLKMVDSKPDGDYSEFNGKFFQVKGN